MTLTFTRRYEVRKHKPWFRRVAFLKMVAQPTSSGEEHATRSECVALHVNRQDIALTTARLKPFAPFTRARSLV